MTSRKRPVMVIGRLALLWFAASMGYFMFGPDEPQLLLFVAFLAAWFPITLAFLGLVFWLSDLPGLPAIYLGSALNGVYWALTLYAIYGAASAIRRRRQGSDGRVGSSLAPPSQSANPHPR
jgi:hypothetical protein